MISRSPTYALPSYARLIWVFLNFALGLFPAVLFFIWIERNTALPYLPIEFGWPWYTLPPTSAAAAVLWNLILILGFGASHTIFAQANAVRTLEKIFPPQTIRTVYMMITGVAVLLVMGLWQHTGIILWNLPLPGHYTQALSIAIYYSLMSMAGRQAGLFDIWQFIGLRQLYSFAKDTGAQVGNPELITTGYFKHVRHPVYTITLCAFIAAPMMSLDRLVVIAGSLLYLAVGIPIEEKKLFTTFGENYKRYQAQVPAILPRFLK